MTRIVWMAVAAAVLATAQQSNTLTPEQQAAQNQAGEMVLTQTPSAMPGPQHTLADAKRALQTMDAIFAAYAKAPPLNPPRGFQVIHNSNADSRETPRGRPIPVTMGLILLPYDSTRRLPNGRFRAEEEGPVLGGVEMNVASCGAESVKDWGDGAFYFQPQQTATVHGWPSYSGVVFLTRRKASRFAPVSAERVLNAQTAKARGAQKEVQASDSYRPQNVYQEFMKGKQDRLRQYQETHDQLAKANKKQADDMLAQLLKAEEQNEKNMAAMAQQQGGGLNQMVDQAQANANKAVQDLQAQLQAMSPVERAAPAFIYQSGDGKFPVGQAVPAGTQDAVAVVEINAEFFDKSLPLWEAQSICVNLNTGPRSQGHRLYPTIRAIWNSLDWDAIAGVM